MLTVIPAARSAPSCGRVDSLASLAFTGIPFHASMHRLYGARCHGSDGVRQIRAGAIVARSRRARGPRHPHRHGELELRLHACAGHRHPCLAERSQFLQAHGAEARGCGRRALRSELHHAARRHGWRQCQDVGTLTRKADHGSCLVASTGRCHRGINPSNKLFSSILRWASCSPRACRLIFDFFALGKISSCSSLT